MSSSNSNIELKIGLGFGIDQSSYSKTLTDISNLRSVLSSGNDEILNLKGFNADLKEAYATADKLEAVLRNSWNSRIGQLDMTKFNKNLIDTFGSVEKIKESLSKSGDVGKTVFNNFSRSILHSNVQLKETSKVLDDLATSMGNTIKWGITSSIFNKLTGAVQKAWNYSVQLDTSLNDIRIVTGKSADEMERFAKTANAAAQNLGTSTKDFTNASLIYYQQGYSDEEAQERAKITLKAANVTGQSASEVSEQLTAVWNGYKVSLEEAELYIDKLAAVAATTAADLEELSTGMSKVASAANVMGVDIDQLSAQLATIVSVTRQAPESVGVALKTIYARMGDIEAGLDTETTLGSYTAQMAALGINVLDGQKKLRDMGEVIEEIGAKWSDFSREEQIALSQIMAGTRQYNNLLALFDNWDDYEQALLTSAAAAGTLNEQQEIYMDSVEAHLQKIATEAEEAYDILFDTSAVKGFLNQIEDLFKMINMHLGHIHGFGGIFGSIGQLGALGANIFQKQAGNALEKRLTNKEGKRANEDREAVMQQFRNAHALKGEFVYNEKALETEIQVSERISNIQRVLTEEELKELTAQQERLGILVQQVEEAERYLEIAQQLNNEKWLEDFEGDEISVDNIERGFELIEETSKATNDALEEMEVRLQEASRFVIEKQQHPMSLAEIETEQNEYADLIGTKDFNLKLQQWQAASKTNPQYLFIDETTGELENKAEVLDRMIDTLQNAKTALDKEAKEYADELIVALDNGSGVLNQEQLDKLHMIVTQTEGYYASRRKMLKAVAEGQQTVKTGQKEQIEEEINAINDQIDSTERLKKRSMELSDAIGGLSAAYMIGGNIVGIYQAATDKSLSTMERLQTIISMGASGLLIYAQNAQQLAQIFPILVKNVFKLNTLEEASAMIQEKKVLGTIKATIAQIAKNIQDAISIKLEKLKIALQNKEIVAIGALILATAALAVATAALITKIIKANSEETKLNKTLEEAEKHYKKVTEAYSKTKDLHSNFLSAKEAVEGLTSGTVEFANAVLDANEKALELIETLNLVAGKDYVIGEGGLIHIDEDALEEAMYDKQREVFRAQGQKFKAQYDIAAFEREQIVEDFQLEATRKSAFGIGMSKETAEGILGDTLNFTKVDDNNAVSDAQDLSGHSDYQAAYKDTRSKIGDVGNFFMRLLAPISTQLWSVGTEIKEQGTSQDEAANITEEVSKFRSEYLQKSEEMLALERQMADSYIRAYADEETLKVYNDANKQQQKYMQDYTTKHIKEISAAFTTVLGDKSKTASFFDTSDETGWKKFGIDLLENFIKSIPVIGSIYKMDEMKSMFTPSDMYLKELYAKEVLGYKKDEETGVWTDSRGNKVDEKKIRNIDTQVAKDAFASGEYGTKYAIEKVAEILSDSKAKAEAKGFNEDERNYVAEGVLAATVGDDTYDFSILTDKEKEEIKRQITESAKDGVLTTEQQAVIDKMDATDYSDTKRFAADTNRFSDRLELESQQLGTTSDALKLYALASEKAGKENVKLTASVAKNAAASYKFNKAYNEGRKTFEDNADAWDKYIDAIKNGKDISYDVADAGGAIIGSLREMGLELSNSQLADPKVLEKVKTIFTGTAEEAKKAYKELRDIAWLDGLISKFGIAKTRAEEFIKVLENTKLGDTLKIDDFINEMSGVQMSLEDWKKWAETYGISVEVEKPEVDVESAEFGGEPVYTKHIVEAHEENGKTVPRYEYIETIIPAKTKVYGIGDLKLTKTSTGGTNFTPGPSGSGSKPKKEKLDKDPSDRYHDVNIELKQINHELEKMQKEQSKLVGSALIANLQKQYDLLNRELDKTAEKIAIAKGEQDELQNALAGSGVTFNPDGTIANYTDAWNAQYAKLKAVVDRYNSMSAKGQENYQETLDKAKEEWETFKENVSRYDELVSEEIPGMEAAIQDAMDKQIEIKLEAFEYEIKLRLDLAEAERDWNSFKAKVLDGIDEDDILGNARAKLANFHSYYNEEGTGEVQSTTKHINNILEQLHQMDADQAAGVYGNTYKYVNAQGEEVEITYNDRQRALDDLKEYYTKLMGSLEDVYELEKEIHESYLDMMDEAQEKFKEQLELYKTIDGIIQHDMELAKMMYGEDTSLAKYYDEQEENLAKQMEFQKSQIAFWKAEMNSAEEGSDKWEKARENWMAAGEEWRSLVEQNIQLITDKYLDSVNTIFNNLNNKVTNGDGLDYLSTEWELINKNADRYLDQVNSIYSIQSLQNKYQDAIDRTNSPAQQKKLNDLMADELAILKEKDKLSQYDIDRANLKYEIALKQMALEEAQQNKTQLRLRRDSQGNYTYQYTSDEDDIAQKQQELSDLYNQLYNMDTEQYRSNLDELFSIWQEYQEAMREAAQINDPTERAKKQELIEREYGQLINSIIADNESIKANLQQSTMSQLFNLYEQNAENYDLMTQEQKDILDNFINEQTEFNGMAFDNLFNLYNENLENYRNMSQEQINTLLNSFIPQWKSGIQKMADTINGEGGFSTVTKQAMDELDKLASEWDAKREAAYKEATTMATEMQTAITNWADKNSDLTDTYTRQLEEIQKVIDELAQLKLGYEASQKAAEDATKAAYEYWKAVNNEAANADNTIIDNGPVVDPNKTPEPEPEPKKTLDPGNEVTVKPSANTFATGETMASWVPGNKFIVSQLNTSGDRVLLKDPSGPHYDKGITGWVKKTDLVGFRTGGYTGDWNSSNGRLAMLHQKELVLNAQDTKNMLNAIQIVRTITENLGTALLNKLGTITANAGANLLTSGDALEQIVHIDAQFPNVTSSSEIEQALNNLVNSAAQHITKN